MEQELIEKNTREKGKGITILRNEDLLTLEQSKSRFPLSNKTKYICDINNYFYY